MTRPPLPKKIIPAILLLCALFQGLSACDLSDTVKAVITAAGFNPARVGVCIRGLDIDTIKADNNADSLFNPASLTKLFTSMASLDALGPRYLFTTRVYTADSLFNPQNGTIRGPLYIRGGGDPGLNAERMWLFAWQLRLAGVTAISGDIILDDSYFDNQYEGPGYEADNTNRAYEAPVCALSANFNTASLQAQAGPRVGSPLSIVMFPPLADVRIENKTTTTAKAAYPNLAITERNSGGEAILSLSGSLGINEGSKRVYRRADNPVDNFGRILMGLLPQAGISVTGSCRRGLTPESLLSIKPFLSFESEPLINNVNGMNKYSTNFIAEMLFKNLGAYSSGTAGTFANGSDAVKQWWRTMQPRGRDTILTLINGSGMGDVNRTTPSALVYLLSTAMRYRPWGPEFASSLPVGGVDGTIKSRFKSAPLAGFVRGKTGTLNSIGVSNLAGYVLVPGKRLSYSILIQDPSHSVEQRWALQEKILSAVIRNLR